ncbi:hypothetical protein [Pantoea stewartii]|uniref:hypothetical protein n=1 Tax=Pantoea stewartii TaxID=66269 RepID=UPI00162352F0|nr:hypothetical protein [Pantoea stewartii]MBC0856771.1 hypothetical protein [Pantoea stewartii]
MLQSSGQAEVELVHLAHLVAVVVQCDHREMGVLEAKMVTLVMVMVLAVLAGQQE